MEAEGQMCLWEEAPASHSASLEDERAWAESLASCSSSSELAMRLEARGYSGRTSPAFLTPKTMRSNSSSTRFKGSGMSASRGEFLTLSSSEWPSDAAVCFLSDTLEQGGGAAAVLFESESVRGNTKTSKQKREELARAAGRGSSSGGSAGFCGYASSTARSIGYAEETAPTLKGNDFQNQVPDVLHATAIRTAQTGANGIGVSDEATHTVDAHGPEAVAYAVRMREGKAGGGKGPLVQTDMSGTIATGNDQTILCKAYTQFGDEIAGTLTARADSSPCIDRGQNVLCMTSKRSNSNASVDMAPTVDSHAAKGDLLACIPEHRGLQLSSGQDVVGTLCAQDTKVSNEFVEMGKLIAHRNSAESAVEIRDGSRWVVRRLTPTECERLQGFPDGWTDVPFKGKEHPSDTPRYKAIGNSMAVPVMRWIGERIEFVDKIIKEGE